MKHITLIIGFLVFCISCKNVSNREYENQNVDSKELEKRDNRKLAYQNNGFISLFDISTRKTNNLLEGSDPCISPDGKWIAYTESSNTGKDYSRRIRLLSIENSAKKDLDINDKNHHGAIWSPTGEYLAFCIMKNGWQIGLIKSNSSDFKILSTDSEMGLYSPTWSQDGKFVFAHNLKVLYKFSIMGELIEKYDLMQLFGNKYYFSSSTRFCFTSNNNKIIFEGGIDEFIEGLDEPSSAIFSYDLTTKTIKRISKKGLCATDLWIDRQDRIYFSGFEDVNKPRKIYQTSLTDTTLIELINGMRPSIGQ